MISLDARVPYLEERIEQLLQSVKGGSSLAHAAEQDLHNLDPARVVNVAQSLQRSLILIKYSGSVLLREKNGNPLSPFEHTAETLRLLSQLGLNVHVVHGGQEQLDKRIEQAFEAGEISEEDYTMAIKWKKAEVRCTPVSIMPYVVEVSQKLSAELQGAILRDGQMMVKNRGTGRNEAIRTGRGNARSFQGPLFYAKRHEQFNDPQEGRHYAHSYYGHLELGKRMNVMYDRFEKVVNYFAGVQTPNSPWLGHIAIRGFLANMPPPQHAKTSVHKQKDNTTYLLNVDADRQVVGHAIMFGGSPFPFVREDGTVEWKTPERLYLFDVTRGGGLRRDEDMESPILDVVVSRNDLERRLKDESIGGGMRGKILTMIQASHILNNVMGVPSLIKIGTPEVILHSLFGYEHAMLQGTGRGIDTTVFVPGREKLKAFYENAARL